MRLVELPRIDEQRSSVHIFLLGGSVDGDDMQLAETAEITGILALLKVETRPTVPIHSFFP